jgi:DNA replication protein DnaC/DNA-directed RNA polymerase specialized sigma24 family protein
MTIQELLLQDVLDFADDLVFEKTGKHLTDLQQAVIKGAYQGKSYAHIAKERYCSSGHVKDIAYGLWDLLSELLGEKIDKFNLGSTLERYTISKISCLPNSVLQINNNACLNTINLDNGKNQNIVQEDKIKYKRNYDLRELPQASSFYGRNQELSQLQEWITQKNNNLILIYGIKGIGKTSLIIEIMNTIKNNFDYIGYYSLKINPCLEYIENKICKLFSSCEEQELLNEITLENSAEKLTKIMDLLNEKRCLIIFDDLQYLFNQENEQVIQEFSLFFEQVGQLQHQSCLVLLSSINLRNIADLSLTYSSIKLLQLTDLAPLAAKQLLQEIGINDDGHIEKLIQRYQAHPLWLKQVVNMIMNLLNGDPSIILDNEQTLLTNNMQQEFKTIINQISNPEKQILTLLANDEEKLSIGDICQKSSLSLNEVINGIEKLSDRCLIRQSKSYFHIDSLLKTYLIQTKFVVGS